MKIFCLIAAVGISAIVSVVAPNALDAQSGRLKGTVLTSPDEKPLSDAEVTIEALNLSVRSDSAGRYVLPAIPRGRHRVVVRHIGYTPFIATLIFADSAENEADFLLEALHTTLETVSVRAEMEKRYARILSDFEGRRKYGFGKFLTTNVIERNAHLTLGAMLQNLVGGVRVQNVEGNRVVVSGRGGGTCPVQVIRNNLTLYNGDYTYVDIDTFPTDQLLGVEFYSRLYTPAEFMARPRGPTGGSGCGTLILWMK